MLDACGVASAEELFAHLPEAVRLKRPLDLAPGISEYEIVDYFRAARGRKRQRLRVVPGRGRLPPLPPGAGGYGGFARRVSDFLHALSGGNLAGHAHHHLRIPDHDLPAHRHGRGQRLHVRRLDRRAGSGHDGRARHRQGARAGRPHACIRSIARCCAPTPRTRACRWRNSATMPEAGTIDLEDLERKIDDLTAAVIVQSPNFFGIVDQVKAAAEIAHRRGALLVVVFTEAVSLGILEPPADADIVAGELQSFAISPSYGGPVRRHHRHAGKVHPPDARPPGGPDHGYARQPRLLPDAFHARAAHPPREGHLQHLHQPGAHRPDGDGLHDASTASRACASWPSRTSPRRTTWPAKLKPRFSGTFFNEFVARVGEPPDAVNKALLKKKIIGGLPLGPLLSRAGRLPCCSAPPK